jgi:hypothetical protein
MVIEMNLSPLAAAALAAALVAAASVLAFSAMPALFVWAAFIAWASYDHSGACVYRKPKLGVVVVRSAKDGV